MIIFRNTFRKNACYFSFEEKKGYIKSEGDRERMRTRMKQQKKLPICLSTWFKVTRTFNRMRSNATNVTHASVNKSRVKKNQRPCTHCSWAEHTVAENKCLMVFCICIHTFSMAFPLAILELFTHFSCAFWCWNCDKIAFSVIFSMFNLSVSCLAKMYR